MKISGLRWWVVGLIALATVINYIDRQSLNVLWPEISVDLYPDKTDDQRKEIYALISVVFVFSYAFGQALFGKIFDWVGTRLGFVLSIGVWSLATALHAVAGSVASFAFFRSILGIAEAGNWPGATKGNAEWFPTRERALAQGIFNSGAAIGGIISIPLIAFLSVYFNWQVIFVLVGATGLLWLIPWVVLVKAPPKSHPWISEQERQYILTGQRNQDADKDGNFDEGYNPGVAKMLSHKESWGVIIASAVIDPIWWLFVFWIPIYLSEVYGMDVQTIGIYACFPFVFSQILPLLTYAGLLVVPVGAIVFAEHQIFPRIGYTRYWSRYQDYAHSLPAVASWGLGLLFGFGLNYLNVMSFYYLFIPTWFFTIAVYTVLAGRYGAKKSYPEAQAREEQFDARVEAYHRQQAEAEPVVYKDHSAFSKILTGIGYLALLITLVLAAIVLFGSADETAYVANRETFYRYVFICTIIYFVTAYWAMQRGKSGAAALA